MPSKVRHHGFSKTQRHRWLHLLPTISLILLLLITTIATIVLISYYYFHFYFLIQKNETSVLFASQKNVVSMITTTTTATTTTIGDTTVPKTQIAHQCPIGSSLIRTVQDLYTYCTASPQHQHQHHQLIARVRNVSCIGQSIETWTDVQQCLTGSFRDDNNNNKQKAKKDLHHYDEIQQRQQQQQEQPQQEVADYEIHIIGERSSGTKYVMREIQKCFTRHGLYHVRRTHRDFVRAKHFFQPMEYQFYDHHHHDMENTKNHSSSSSSIFSSMSSLQHSIIVAIFRDPVSWIAAMREKPYHSPNHLTGFFDNETTSMILPLPWDDFVARSWSMPRNDSLYDVELLSNQHHVPLQHAICREQFPFHQVIPCRYNSTRSQYHIPSHRFRGYEPIYELHRDNSGTPFRNILELRAEKIFNFLIEIPVLLDIAGYVPVRYEDLLQHGTRDMMTRVAMAMGLSDLPTECIARLGGPQPHRLEHRMITNEFRQYIYDHVDWDRERLLGYHKE
jgi:hypothetical protein